MPYDSYVREKFMIAVDILASGRSDIKTRVKDAWGSSLTLISERHPFPTLESKMAFRELKEDLDFLGPGASGILLLDEYSASEFASRIVSISNKLERFQGAYEAEDERRRRKPET